MLSLILATICVLLFLLVDPTTLALWPTDLHWWQFVTYGFAHSNALHLILNVLALLSFGPALERAWGRKWFLVAYAACLVVGGVAHAVTSAQPMVGASAAIIGLFAAFVMANPKRKVISVFIVELPAWIVLTAYLLLSAAALAFHWAVGVAHVAHLAGASAGVLCALANKKPRQT